MNLVKQGITMTLEVNDQSHRAIGPSANLKLELCKNSVSHADDYHKYACDDNLTIESW